MAATTALTAGIAFVRQRLGAFGVNAYAQLNAVIVQLLTVPVFIASLGLEGFGNWTVLVAVQGYFSILDFGYLTAAMNRSACLAAAGEQTAAQELIDESVLLAGGLGGGTLLLCLALYAGRAWFAVGEDFAAALLCLIASAQAAYFYSVLDAVYRAGGRYASGTFTLETIRLFEWLLTCGIVFATHDVVLAAGGGALGKTLALLWAGLRENASANPYKIRWRPRRWRAYPALTREALSWSAFRVGETLLLQGGVIAVAATLGAASAAVFSAYRTLSRSVFQFSTAISHSLWPEYSQLIGRGDRAGLRRLERRGRRLAGAFAVTAGAILYLLAPWIIAVWGKQSLPRLDALLGEFIVLAVLAAAWYPLKILLMAGTRLTLLAPTYLAVCVATLGGFYLACREFGLAAGLAVLIASEILLFLRFRQVVERHVL